MTERRKHPITRCPEHVKDKIAHASVKKVIDRMIFNIKHIKPREEVD